MLAGFSAAAFGANELSNRRAPGFALPDLQQKYHDPADYRGRVVIVNIMNVGCPHCREFSKVLNEAEKKYGERLKVLSIVNPPDNQQDVRGYMIANQISTTILFDSGQASASYMKISASNPTFSVPHFFVIDREGVIREDYGYAPLERGAFESEGLYRILDKYAAKPSVAGAAGGKSVD